jgi:hypothetical protein
LYRQTVRNETGTEAERKANLPDGDDAKRLPTTMHRKTIVIDSEARKTASLRWSKPFDSLRFDMVFTDWRDSVAALSAEDSLTKEQDVK